MNRQCVICLQGNGEKVDDEIKFPELKLECENCKNRHITNDIHVFCFAKYYWITIGKTSGKIIEVCCSDAILYYRKWSKSKMPNVLQCSQRNRLGCSTSDLY